MSLRARLKEFAQSLPREFRDIAWRWMIRFRKQTTLRTKQGILVVPLARAEYISRCLFCDGQYELDWMNQVLKHLRMLRLCPSQGRGTLLDVGANIGVISIGALVNGEFERAIAVEPEPRDFSFLQQNVVLNQSSQRMVCLRYAVSDRSGEVTFELSVEDSGDHRVRTDAPIPADLPEQRAESHRPTVQIPARTLDELIEEVPAVFRDQLVLMWVDVQGHEGHVFAGGSRLLSGGLPTMAEIWPYGLRRAGMDASRFTEIVARYWTRYWVWRRKNSSPNPSNFSPCCSTNLGKTVITTTSFSLADAPEACRGHAKSLYASTVTRFPRTARRLSEAFRWRARLETTTTRKQCHG